jgi:hypothetical protein
VIIGFVTWTRLPELDRRIGILRANVHVYGTPLRIGGERTCILSDTSLVKLLRWCIKNRALILKPVSLKRIDPHNGIILLAMKYLLSPSGCKVTGLRGIAPARHT